MKSSLILLFSLLIICNSSFAQSKKKKIKSKSIVSTKNKINTSTSEKTNTNQTELKEIDWLTWEEAQKRMVINPKKVYVDIYTDWCGWCKVMERKTFTNPNVIQYMNEHFYCIRFNCEKDNNINFKGKLYKIENGNNQLAVELMRNSMSFPTSIFFEENFENPQPVPGYLDVKTIQPIVNYLGGNFQKTTPFQDYQKSFKVTWE